MNAISVLFVLAIVVLLIVITARAMASKPAKEHLVNLTRNTLDESSRSRFDHLVQQFKKNNQNQLKVRDLMMLKKQAQS